MVYMKWRKENIKKLCVTILILLIGVTGCEGNNASDVSEVITKLQKFTRLVQEDEKYSFNYNMDVTSDSSEKWSLNYVEINEFVRFQEDKVAEYIADEFGEEYIIDDPNREFSYDLDENEFRIYLDIEVKEGNLTIINYNIDNDEFVVMIDGEKYEASDEFVESISRYDLVDTMKDDLEKFKSKLDKEGLSLDEVTQLSYEDIASYLE